MGEYADMYLDGTLDVETGELIDGDSPGHPRSPARDRREKKNTLTLDLYRIEADIWSN